jgi:hypothetical protein
MEVFGLVLGVALRLCFLHHCICQDIKIPLELDKKDTIVVIMVFGICTTKKVMILW